MFKLSSCDDDAVKREWKRAEEHVRSLRIHNLNSTLRNNDKTGTGYVFTMYAFFLHQQHKFVWPHECILQTRNDSVLSCSKKIKNSFFTLAFFCPVVFV